MSEEWKGHIEGCEQLEGDTVRYIVVAEHEQRGSTLVACQTSTKNFRPWECPIGENVVVSFNFEEMNRIFSPKYGSAFTGYFLEANFLDTEEDIWPVHSWT